MSKYSSISMVILHIADNLVLKLKVNLYRKLLKQNQMKLFYSEVEYYNVNHHEEVTNINLDYSYGLVLESPYSEPKASVWIDWFGIYELTNVLQKVIKWFTEPITALYQNVNGHMELTPEGNKLHITTVINKIPMIFNPTVLIDPLTNVASAGVTLTYTVNSVRVTIPIENIMAWYSYVSRVDIAAAAQSLLSYIKPPDPGTNCISFINGSISNDKHTDRIDYKNHGLTNRRFDQKDNDDELK